MSQTKEINIKYKRKDVDGGYLFDKEEIAYFKQSQTLDVMDNLMVGDFNMVGTYVIDKAVLEQLVKLKKVFLYEFSRTMFCESINKIGKYGKLQFAVKIQPNTPKIGTITAILQLLEPITKVNGYLENTNVVFLATYMDVDNPDFFDKMFNKFHIYKMEDASNALKENDTDLQDILDRKKYLETLHTKISPSLEKLYKELFEKRLKAILKSSKSKIILEEFNKKLFEVDGSFISKGSPNYYKYLNQILDGILDTHVDYLKMDPVLKAELNQLSFEFAEAIEHIIENTSASLNDAKQTKVQQEVKKSAGENYVSEAKKPSGKSDVKSSSGSKPDFVPPKKKNSEVKKEAATEVSSVKTNKKIERIISVNPNVFNVPKQKSAEKSSVVFNNKKEDVVNDKPKQKKVESDNMSVADVVKSMYMEKPLLAVESIVKAEDKIVVEKTKTIVDVSANENTMTK